ncbi:MAG TPA: TonB-dependent receptor, partial [Caldimonas sp.]|nr:TonB-dependent receptor [Caldimonas sp.]
NAQYDSAEFNPPDYTADPSPDFRNRLHTSVVSLDYRGVVSPLWTTTLQASRNVDDLNSGGTTLTRYKTDREQQTWQNALHLGAGQQVMLAYEHLGEKVSGDVFTAEPQRTNNAFVLGYSGRYGLAGLQASVRHDDNSVYGDNTTGSVGATYQISPQFKLRALAGTTFRAPTFNDLFYPGYGVSSIQPERGRSFEVGASWQSGNTSATATVYRNDVRDLIGYDPDPTGAHCPPGYFGCAANTSRARLQGATLGATQQWDGLEMRATVDFLDARDADTGVRLARRAAHQETLAVSYTRNAWSAGASLLDVGSRPDGGVVLGGYGIVDVHAAWRFHARWRLEAKLLNALDHRVEPVRDYQGLGRQAWIGVTFDGNGF